MPDVRLRLKTARTELRRTGYAMSKPGRSMVFWDGAGRVPLPAGLWREPTTGVLRLLPSVFDARMEEDPSFASWRRELAEWETIASQWREVASRQLLLQRASPEAVVEGMIAIAGYAIVLSGEMAWAMWSRDPLAVNEGFAVQVQPFGTFGDRATEYLGLAFGGRLYLALGMNGTAALLVNRGYGSGPENWKEIERFSWSGGGVTHTAGYQVTVIPWGESYLSIVFSQIAVPAQFVAVHPRGARREAAFLVDLSRHKVPTPPVNGWDTVKTHASRLGVAVRKAKHQYALRVLKVRYPSPVTTYLAPGSMDEPLPSGAPQTFVVGRADWETLYLGPRIGASVVMPDLSPWDPATGTRPTVRLYMEPSTGGLYSPEVWQVDASIPPETHTPTLTPEDISARWYQIRFKLTTELEPTRGTIRLRRPYETHLGRSVPMRLEMKAPGGSDWLVMLDGYVERRMPTGEGPVSALRLNEELEVLDMWDRLDNVSLGRQLSAESRSVADVASDAIAFAGFQTSEIECDPMLKEMVIEPETDPTIPKQWEHDARPGDVIRELGKAFGVQGRPPLRCRWDGAKWILKLGPQYDPAVKPPCCLVLGPNTLAATLAGGATTDILRWQAKVFYARSQPEWTVERSEFNALRVVAPLGAVDDPEAAEIIIGPDPKVLTDPGSPLYEGGLREKVLGPPEVTATDMDALRVFARHTYDQAQRGLIQLGVSGEWQPGCGLDPDAFVWVAGQNAAGSAVSFGAYRIETVDVEVRHDHTTARFEWTGSYSLVYVGATQEAVVGLPMVAGWPA